MNKDKRFDTKELNIKRIVKANNKSYDELSKEIEEEKLYLTRLYQQGKNENTKMKINDLEFLEEINLTKEIITSKEDLLHTLSVKNKEKRSKF